MKLFQHNLIRNISYMSIIEIFLVTSVSSLILVRFFLAVTDYPRIGGGNFHIAHMLWGGLLLVTALMLCLIFLNRGIRYAGAIVGGIGFGLFIDELGKFITADNNYLYQPALALIYVIFVAFFMIFRKIGSSEFTEEEYFVNSIEYMKEGITGELTKEEKDKTIGFLKHVHSNSHEIKLVREALIRIPPGPPNRFDGIAAHIYKWRLFYRSFSSHLWFKRLIVTFFFLSAGGSLIGLFFIAETYISSPHLIQTLDFSSSVFIQTVSSIVGNLFVLLGMAKIRRSPYDSYRYFKRYILIDILISTVFEFYTNQLWAVTGLVFDLFLLTTLNFMIEEEKVKLLSEDNEPEEEK